ncbi:MAG: hypothetical protein WCW63_01710 [Acholeplasmataceae bacterium]
MKHVKKNTLFNNGIFVVHLGGKPSFAHNGAGQKRQLKITVYAGLVEKNSINIHAKFQLTITAQESVIRKEWDIQIISFPPMLKKNALLVVKNLRQNHLKSKEDLAYIAQKIVSISRKMEKLKVFVCNVELNLFIQEQGTLNIVAINAGELQHQKKNLYFGKVAKHQK